MGHFQDVRSRDYTVEDLLSRSFQGAFGPRFLEMFVPVFVLFLVMLAATFMNTSTTEVPVIGPPLGPWIGFGVVFVVLAIVCMQFVLRRARQAIDGEPETIGQSLGESLSPLRFVDFVVSALLAGVLIMLGTFVLVLPGVALTFVFALLPACVTFAEGGFRISFSEPFVVLQGRFWRTVGAFVVLGIVFSVISWVLSIPMAISFPGWATRAAESGPASLSADLSAWSRSPLVVATAIASAVVGSLQYVVSGFMTVVVYVNYRAVRPHTVPDERAVYGPGGPEQRDEGGLASRSLGLRQVYEQEQLAQRQDLIGVSGLVPGDPRTPDIDYGRYSAKDLLDVHGHLNAEAHSGTYRVLLAEIKRRVEAESGDRAPGQGPRTTD